MPRNSYRQICLSVLFVFMLLFCAAGAHEANASISVTGSIKDTLDNPVSGAHIEMVGSPSISTTSGADGSFILNGLPSGAPFSLEISKNGYMPSYTHNMNSTQNIVKETSYTLHTSSEVASWGVISGKGVIHARVVNDSNPLEYINGAVVSCDSSLHPGACPYAITYYNGTTLGGTSTYGNGKYYILNVDNNDTVTVTASKGGWSFSPRTFITHADAVSKGRIAGTPNGSISGTVSYSGSRPGPIHVGLFSSPVINPGLPNPLYYVQLGAPGAYSFTGVHDGTYYIGAIKTNNVFVIQMEDPYGMYGIDFVSDFTPDPVVVSGGNAVTGKNFAMVDGTQQNPNPFYPSQVANNPFSVELACPASVNVGNPLTVTVNLYNWDCYASISVDRFMKIVMGNANGTLSGLGIFGPYYQKLGAPKVVPPATCDASGTTPGSLTPFNLTVMNAVPTSLSGKMATVIVEATTTKGESSGNECVVNVVP